MKLYRVKYRCTMVTKDIDGNTFTSDDSCELGVAAENVIEAMNKATKYIAARNGSCIVFTSVQELWTIDVV